MAERLRQPQQETEIRNEKIFRTYKQFGVPHIMSILFGDSSEHERKVIELFKQNGFRIEFAAPTNSDNPFELGISSDKGVDIRRRDEEIAQAVGIEMPKTIDSREMLVSSEAVVAKLPYMNNGDLKYLLETKEQKVKFLTWALLDQKLGTIDDTTAITRVMKKVENGEFDDELIHTNGRVDPWVFEEYITTPGEFSTSIRVVSDATGTIHYSQIVASGTTKHSEIITSSESPDELGMVGSLLSNWLVIPKSPLFLASRCFTSNVATGGKRILLTGKKLESPHDRTIATDLGIHPDNPRLPERIAQQSSQIGQLFRQFYPHVGIDYIYDARDMSYKLLEINKGPSIAPEAIGLPDTATPHDCQLEIIRRTIANISNQGSKRINRDPSIL